ncbi:MAG: DUF2853 domain-containing protein [Rhodovulum sulfidophilum]|uniref:DUF2853 domain-containing protein n=1 Tax=Rhodovulum sulfidophilum TaxID=35806 RepID=A0A2W5NI04_RHOSU|nr:MAG: DUF2853 domain-containing protein [Rhodovulum sulfidophilum]
MGKRDDLIASYAADITEKCGQTPDIDLLTKVTIGCGPAIYSADAALVAASDPEELARIKENYLMKKLGLADGPELDKGLDAVIETYGRSHPRKHRAVVYYLLTKHFGKEATYA